MEEQNWSRGKGGRNAKCYICDKKTTKEDDVYILSTYVSPRYLNMRFHIDCIHKIETIPHTEQRGRKCYGCGKKLKKDESDTISLGSVYAGQRFLTLNFHKECFPTELQRQNKLKELDL
jgi:hypothetical protein